MDVPEAHKHRNQRLARSLLVAFNSMSFTAARRLCAPAVTIVGGWPELPSEGGGDHADLRQAFDQMRAHLAFVQGRVLSLEAGSDRVVAHVRVRMRGRAHPKNVELKTHVALRIGEGRITHVAIHDDRDAALAAIA